MPVTFNLPGRLIVNKKEKNRKMKTTINIIAKRVILVTTLFLVSGIQLVIAKSPASTSKTTFDIAALAPVTPKEATFDDILPEKAPAMVSVAPVTPKEATFEDDDTAPEVSTDLLKKVAPETPKEADFDETPADTDKNIRQLIIFRAPVEALFIDF